LRGVPVAPLTIGPGKGESPGVSPPANRAAFPRPGVAAAAAFLLWGLVPLFWKQLSHVTNLELVAHRAGWTFVFLLLLIRRQHRLGELRAAFRSPQLLRLHALSAALITVNWLMYVWAVAHDHIVEASLGYFLTPLVNVASGWIFFRERLRPIQMAAVILAAVGVAVQVVAIGHLPWIALVLAFSFGGYGLLRKQGPLGSMVGLAVETGLLTPLAFGWLLLVGVTGGGALGHVSPADHLLLVSTGVVTAVPLLFFAIGARGLSLATLGIFQFLAPSMKLIVGTLVYHEPFGGPLILSFGLIWIGLIVYTLDSFRSARHQARTQVAAPVVSAAGEL